MNLKNILIAVLGMVLLAGTIFIFTQWSNNQQKKVVVKPPASQIVKMTENSTHLKKPDGTIEAKFYDKPINYQDENGNWHPIDTTLKLKGDIYRGDGTQVSVGKDGTVRVDGMSLTQKTSRIGYLNPQTQEFTLVAELKEGKIKENKFIREAGSLRHELTLFENGLKEELILSEKPTGWKFGDLLVLETQVGGMDLPQGLLENNLRVGNLIFPLPTLAAGRHGQGSTKRFAKEISGRQYLYTGVPVSWLAEASYPVVIDPDFAGSTNDGYVYGSSSVSYLDARSTSTNYDVASVDASVGQYDVFIFTDNYTVARTALKFDTSSIGAGSTITQVNLKLASDFDSSDTDFDVQIVDQNWSAQDPLTHANREAFYDNCLAGTADSGSPWRNTLGMSINTLYTSPNLSTSWVSKTASTYYCLRSSRDSAINTPTGLEQIGIITAENSDTTLRPVLTVAYTSVVVPTVTTSAATNVVNTTATGNGNITATGGANATSEGVEWGTTSGSYPNSVTSTGSFGVGAFTQGMTGLTAGTVIYYRAKATNSAGTGYGSEQSFTTLANAASTLKFEKVDMQGINLPKF